jgi:uncharacterized protein (DUF2267 family)
MSMTGLPVFDTTLQKTNEWLHDIDDELGWDSRHKAYQSLRAVLHVVRDHMPLNEAVKLGSQLPMLMRGFYFEGWHPADKPLRDRSAETFLIDISNHFPTDDVDPALVVRAVLSVMAQHLPSGEIDALIRVLPRQIRELCFDPVASEIL